MNDKIEMDTEKMLELMRYSFLRLDGAWFMASVEMLGVETATNLDIKAWEMFSERLGKKISSLINLKGELAQIIPQVLMIQNALLNMNTEVSVVSENKIIHRVLDCEVWKMVQKVWSKDEIPCHKVTLASIQGLLKGAFPESEFVLEFKKKIPLGDPCCEVEITIKK